MDKIKVRSKYVVIQYDHPVIFLGVDQIKYKYINVKHIYISYMFI